MWRSLKFLLVLMFFALFAMPSPAQTTRISGELLACQADSVGLYVLDGGIMRPLLRVPLNEQGGTYSFSMQLTDAPKGFYLLGAGTPENTRTLILGGEQEAIKITGACKDLAQASTWNSPTNQAYEAMLQRANELQQAGNQHMNEYRVALRKRQGLEAAAAAMGKVDQQKLQFLDSLKTNDPFLGKVLALRTYLSYQGKVNATDNYSDERDYFARTFFQFVDWSDPAYNLIPDVHTALRSYTLTLSRIGLTHEQQMDYVNTCLADIPTGSPAHKMALLGATTGFQGSNDDAYVRLAAEFVKTYGDEQPSVSRQLQTEINQLQAQLIGSVAPEIALPTPEGDTLKLSDLRGKVVLIDFWASWCGPCRRENPQVLNVYNKYKDQGFDIYGVSLDRDKASWEKAIEKDGLVWKHVSDLAYFQSVAAQTYGVNAIPHTVLIDEEGRIIAKKLRAAALDRKLAEIFSQER